MQWRLQERRGNSWLTIGWFPDERSAAREAERFLQRHPWEPFRIRDAVSEVTKYFGPVARKERKHEHKTQAQVGQTSRNMEVSVAAIPQVAGQVGAGAQPDGVAVGGGK